MLLRLFSEHRVEHAFESECVALFSLIDDGDAHFYDIVDIASG